ncbi:hypothetical protein [Spiroplasma poulsonii]|uniref:hypothetical protein n=1 Tax=Spiroplasma poulsonii TaxID=2138 RepID=UPI001F4CC52B|nr:hypothetical protein [Spiroplasma poulsonii]UNF62603.1 hypothetical protein MNU24_03900 [Spiroplasma poulsonii]
MIILMMFIYYWCYWTPIQRPKKTKTILPLEKKHTIKTQVIIEQETKKIIGKQVFCSKNMIMLLFKGIKNPTLKIPSN